MAVYPKSPPSPTRPGHASDLIYGPGGFAALHGATLQPVAVAQDAHGSIIPSTGNTWARSATYSAYGTPTGTNTFEARLGYRGELTIDNQVNLRARNYQSSIGMMTSRDPAPGRPGTTTLVNPYHYADNNPLNRTDPTGRTSQDATNGPTIGQNTAVGAGGSGLSSTGKSCDSSACRQVANFAIPHRPYLGQVRANLFIAASKVGGLLNYQGDGRDPSATAGCADSRVCVLLDFESGSGKVVVNYSCRASGSCFDAHTINGGVNELSVTYGGTGDFTLDLLGKHADPGFLETINIPAQIDFSLGYSHTIEPISADIYAGTRISDRFEWSMEDFPSLEVYQDLGGRTKRLGYDPEETPFLGVPMGLISLTETGVTGGYQFDQDYWIDPFAEDGPVI